jgi:hypothetical protein
MLEIKERKCIEGEFNRYQQQDPVLAMEYTSFNGLLDQLKELVELYSESGNTRYLEWSRVYQLFYQRVTLDITAADLTKAVQYKTSDDPELFIAYRLLHAYGTYNLGEYGVLKNILTTIMEEMAKIKGSKLETFYQFRLSQLLANIYFYQNDIENARKQLNIIIAECPAHLYIASAHHTYGLSYLYEDYQAGISLLEKSYQMYEERDRKNSLLSVKRSIIFYNNYWGIDGKYAIYSNNTADRNELAHFEMRRGNRQKALNILSRIDQGSLSFSEEGYYNYYKGLILDNTDFLYKSLSAFKKCENRFAAHMARLELYRRREREAAIEAAYN